MIKKLFLSLAACGLIFSGCQCQRGDQQADQETEQENCEPEKPKCPLNEDTSALFQEMEKEFAKDTPAVEFTRQQ